MTKHISSNANRTTRHLVQNYFEKHWDSQLIKTQNHLEIMNEINMTPLIDVMLVLLIVFMVTLPIINHVVHIELPQVSNQPNQNTATAIDLTINADGKIYWNQSLVDRPTLQQKMHHIASNEPDIQLRADRAVRYEHVAEVMAMAQQNGLKKLSFITEAQPAR